MEKIYKIITCDLDETLLSTDRTVCERNVRAIRAAGLGAAVANVYEGIRGDCDYIAEADNDQGGAGEIIERFVLRDA